MILSRDEQLACAGEAGRAPSAHNVQPACWRFGADGRLVLFHRMGRALPVADPTGHDLAASLGSAWEGMVIALSRLGVSLGAPSLDVAAIAPAAGCTPVAVAPLGRDPQRPLPPDPDAALVLTRRSERAVFAPSPADIAARVASLAAPDVFALTDRALIAQVAEWHDAATLHFMRQRAQVDELVRWLRLSPSHPDWDRDGLTADAMALSPVERIAGRLLLRWPAMRLLRTVGADAALVSEAAQTRSAAAIVAFTPLRATPPFERGRRFHRIWLSFERAGLSACPMSALCDHDASRARLLPHLSLTAERTLAGLWRVGISRGTRARSPRLPSAELLV